MAKDEIRTGLIVTLLTVAILKAMGQPWWCEAGDAALWSGDVWSRHNSQHLIDPYSFTHVLHGLGFYALFRFALGSAGTTARFAAAVVLEAIWEVVENTPMVIERYREATISLDYFGDSIANSAADIAMCVLGYVAARKLPVRWSLLIFAAVELALAATIRDNLTLNVIMLLWPIDAVKAWQSGAVV